uniref:Uncharacterized protein n=1 Tax=Trypanosoma vivax (strain Y486) TaxID=1055687 RepID=G0TS76_TRYVY|nr:hypothetical protein TVY486_0202130 [Trypanosoma vivax Y486]
MVCHYTQQRKSLVVSATGALRHQMHRELTICTSPLNRKDTTAVSYFYAPWDVLHTEWRSRDLSHSYMGSYCRICILDFRTVNVVLTFAIPLDRLSTLCANTLELFTLLRLSAKVANIANSSCAKSAANESVR